MDIAEICRRGYFDRVVIDGFVLPLYNDDGVEIKNEQTLMDGVEFNRSKYNHRISRLRLNIAGEDTREEKPSEVRRMRNHRVNGLKMPCCDRVNCDRYYIGYVDIFIFKSDDLLPESIRNLGKTYEEMERISNNEYELKMMQSAIKLQSKIVKENRKSEKSSVAIIDKLYIHPIFRRCGISTWVHENIKDLILLYGLIDIGATIMMPADFNKESEKMFSMSRKDYEEMLIKHYRKLGYTRFHQDVLYKQFN